MCPGDLLYKLTDHGNQPGSLWTFLVMAFQKVVLVSSNSGVTPRSPLPTYKRVTQLLHESHLKGVHAPNERRKDILISSASSASPLRCMRTATYT